MLPTLKMYKVDYEFLISNYLNKELWKKQWNLFVYKDNVFTLNLSSIDTKNDAITFQIKYNKLTHCWDDSTSVTYYMNNTTIQVLKQQINGAIFRLMEKQDEHLCKQTKGYEELCSLYSDERDKLRAIAESYLDEHGISLDDVREAYIDKYVNDNTKADVYKLNYLCGNRYKYLSDMFIVFTKITDDKNRYNTVVNALQDTSYVERVEKDIKEFANYFQTDEYEEEMNDALDAI